MTLQSLLERVESASGADRELDALIACALFPDEYEPSADTKTGILWRRGWGPCEADTMTSSLDATLALVERVLPGWSVLMAITPTETVCDVHSRRLGDPQGKWPGHATAPTPALALLAAMLRAKIGEDQ